MHLILVLQACQCSPARAPKCCNTFLVLKVSSNWRHLAKLWHLRQIELTAFALKFFAKVAACVLRAVVLLDLLGCVWMVLLCGMGYYAWYHEPWVRFGWSEERGRYWLIYNDMYILRGYAPCRRPLGESEFGTLPAVNIFHSDGGRSSVKVALRSLMAQACRSRRRQHGLQTFMEFERNQKISNSKDEHSKSTGQSKS